MSACRTCSASIRWARTEHGKRIPLDAEHIVCWRGTDDDMYRLVPLAEAEPSLPEVPARSASASDTGQLALEIPRSAYEARA